MYLMQVLLPTRDGSHQPYSRALFGQCRAELVAQFGGITAYLRSPAIGAWTDPEGQVEQDEVVMVEVVAEEFDRSWWQRYTSVLEERFQQQEIHVRAIKVETL